jgi:hypothetical protein
MASAERLGLLGISDLWTDDFADTVGAVSNDEDGD